MITNKHNIPLSLAVWLCHNSYDQNSDPNTISATTLLKPIKSILLGSQVSTSKSDLMDLVSSRMGTAIHTAIEQAWQSDFKGSLQALGYPQAVVDRMIVNPKPEELVEGSIPVYMEIRTEKKIGDWTISGKFDFICDGKLEDFKSTGTYTWINQSNKDKYIQQASVYRWLNPKLITSETFCINYIFTDYSATKAKQDSTYPQSRVLVQEYPLMSISDTERFIKERLKLLDKHKDNPQLAPACTPEELWMKPSVFKYYKNHDKLDRSTKNFDSYWEAHKRLVEDGSTGIVKEVKGEVVFCNYCSAKGICNQAQQYIREGLLIE